MTLRRTGILLVLLGALTSAVLAQGTGSTSAQSDKQFQAALQKEMVAGDLKAAIEEYRRVAERPRVDPALAAQALLRMAECYQKLGSAEAQKIYERIITEYGGQKDAVSHARGRLAALKTAEPAGLTAAPIDTRVSIFWVPSPDGRLAVENGGPSGLILHDPSGTSRILVKSEGPAGRVAGLDMTWSPDSRRIAYHWRMDETNSAEVRIVDIQTAAVQTIAVRPPNLGAVTVRAWTTRGEVVWTAGRRDVLFSVAAPRSEPQRLTLAEGVQFGDVSPDGAELVVVGSEQLARLNRVSGEKQVLTRGFEVSFPRVSVDGKLIAYLSLQTGSWTLRLAPLTGSVISQSIELTRLQPGSQWNRFAHWTSGGRLSFDARLNTDNVYRLQLEGGVPRDGNRLERLVHDSAFASNPIPSSDSRLIAYVGAGGINVMNADGSNERPLGVEGLPLAWLSPEELAFLRSDDEGLRAVSVRTGTIRSIGHDLRLNAAAHAGALSADTFQFLASRNEIVIRRFVDGFAKFFVRRAGGEERLLLEIPLGSNAPDARERLAYWLISPRGDRLAYARDSSLHVVSVDGRDDRVVARIGRASSLSWTDDGRRLVYEAPNPAGLEYRSLDLESGESKVVLESRHTQNVFGQDSSWNLSMCSLTNDQASLVCRALVTTAYRYAWEGVTSATVSKLAGAGIRNTSR